ncbi:uncharacterized protein LOC141719235 [Apium graveolens]|uniref:uncharacterized protein LOC141719235 n=1 Tax=Apium graveolens TaxID=4045 RepID=UPI003D79F0C0
MNEVTTHDDYFLQKRNAAGQLGLSTLQKIIAAFRMLTYGKPADATDEYIKIGESTSIDSLNDVARLLYIGQCRGFPGMLGSNNDINVLESSHLFANLTQGIATPAHYVIEGKVYDTEYYLADGIYPKWSTLIQTIHKPRGPEKNLFAMKQEACRKDVEYERDLSAPIQESVKIPDPEVQTVENDENARFQQFLGRYRKIKNKEAHIVLRDALIEHLWEQYTNSE